MTTRVKTPVTIYVVHHPQCAQAILLAQKLYEWFRLGYLTGDSSAAGLPIHFRRMVVRKSSRSSQYVIHPPINFDDAGLNVVIALVDQTMVVDAAWRNAIIALSEDIASLRESALKKHEKPAAILLPAALHDSFYRLAPLYERFNPIRLLEMDDARMEATLRRAATEATARMLLAENSQKPAPLNIFLSHAKRDGKEIAEYLRDGVRKFSQLVAWYDANDLPYGAEWNSPMQAAAKQDTAAMVATVTDAYPTRPWCRKEAKLARTPVPAGRNARTRVWKVQPVVAVHHPQSGWVRGIPMLDGVPRIGWNESQAEELTEKVVDRLVLEVLLGNVYRKVALDLAKQDGLEDRTDACFITWIPDAWTLMALRGKLEELKLNPASIRRIVYPGFGLSVAEFAELQPVVSAFHPKTKLVSFEEAWA